MKIMINCYDKYRWNPLFQNDQNVDILAEYHIDIWGYLLISAVMTSVKNEWIQRFNQILL